MKESGREQTPYGRFNGCNLFMYPTATLLVSEQKMFFGKLSEAGNELKIISPPESKLWIH